MRERVPGIDRARRWRATSPVVGVVLLVGVTVLLVASVGTAVTALESAGEDPPRVTVTASVRADDGYPDGQTVRLRHAGGDAVAVSRLAITVTVSGGRRGRASGFPTRRLTDEHLSGADLFDRSFAGVDGAVDAATTDGVWTSGDVVELRLAQNHVDVRAGQRVTVTVRYRSGVLVRIQPRATTTRTQTP